MIQIKSKSDQRVAATDPFLLIQNVSKIYPLAKGTYTVLEDVNLVVDQSEFICLRSFGSDHQRRTPRGTNKNLW
jgi:hypothetical protein